MNTFALTIGDWTRDGHGHKETFFVQSNKTFKEALKAYRKAKKKLPAELHPTNFMSDYEDRSLPKETYEAGLKVGFDFLEGFKAVSSFKSFHGWRDKSTFERFESGELFEYPDFGPKEMADYVFWFIKQGDPDIELSLTEVNDLAGYGGIQDQIGYGLFD